MRVLAFTIFIGGAIARIGGAQKRIGWAASPK